MDGARALGSLLGLAIGDALGTTNEFRTMDAPGFPALALGPVDDVVGGGPFALPAGGVTDDTQMAAALADELARAGAVVPAAVAARYLTWREAAFDVGIQIGQALDRVAAGTAPADAGRLVWEERHRLPAGNGSLMRTAVIGVLVPGPAAARRAATFADSVITHFDPRCQLACAAFNASIALAVASGPQPVPAERLVEVAASELAAAAAELRARHADLHAEIDAAAAALAADLAAARAPDPALYGDEVNLQRMSGFVRVAFRLAYWELVHAPTFSAALVDAANRGGDADTNAAIAGALYGAWTGVASIPRPWIGRVLRAPGLETADESLHPRVLLDALAHLHGGDASVAQALANVADATMAERTAAAADSSTERRS